MVIPSEVNLRRNNTDLINTYSQNNYNQVTPLKESCFQTRTNVLELLCQNLLIKRKRRKRKLNNGKYTSEMFPRVCKMMLRP